jgi:hypothetical protein
VAALTRRMISGVVSSCGPGVSSMPPAGMQYVQRRLQRSVRLSLRYVCVRLQG